MGYHFLLQEIFLTQGLNPHLCSSCTAGGFFTTKPPASIYTHAQQSELGNSGPSLPSQVVVFTDSQFKKYQIHFQYAYYHLLCLISLLDKKYIFIEGLSQFSSVHSCLTLCNPWTVCSTPGFPVKHQLLELT